MRDSIHISGLELRAHIGVPAVERADAQRLTASLTLHPTDDFSGLGDRLENTIDYAAVCASIHLLVAERARNLVETLAEDIAAGVLQRFARCAAVDVELRKYALSDTAYVAVRLTRRRSPL